MGKNERKIVVDSHDGTRDVKVVIISDSSGSPGKIVAIDHKPINPMLQVNVQSDSVLPEN